MRLEYLIKQFESAGITDTHRIEEILNTIDVDKITTEIENEMNVYVWDKETTIPGLKLSYLISMINNSDILNIYLIENKEGSLLFSPLLEYDKSIEKYKDEDINEIISACKENLISAKIFGLIELALKSN